MATIGNSIKVVTLTAAERNATITGTIDAYGSVGVFNGLTLDAAVFGPASTHFTLVNAGLVESFDTVSNDDYGIILAAPGTIKNTASIIADRGIAMFGTTAGASIDNTKLIHGTEGSGIYVEGTASILNTGSIIANGGDGIELAAGGSVSNAGTIEGADFGIFSTAPTGFTSVNNSGLIEATAKSLITIGTLTFSAVGIDVYGSGTITNTASIIGVGEGIFLGPSTASDLIVNSGRIDATGTTIVTASGTVGSVGVFLLDGGTIINKAGGTIIGYAVGVDSGLFLGSQGERSRNSTVATSITNSGVIEGSSSTITFSNGTILSSAGGVALVAGGALTNEATGTISGHFGVYLSGGASDIANTIDNLGTIEGFSDFGVQLGEHASLANSGQITGASYGVFAYAANRITNQAGGVISGVYDGVLAYNTFGETSTIANSGHILATYDGVVLTAGGLVVNAGVISATSAGIVTVNDPATIDNTGTIVTSTATYNNGIDLIAGGLITNAGLMEGGSGIFAQDGGTIVNSGSMVLSRSGIYLTGAGTVSNSGLIEVTKSGYNTAVELGAGGLVTNTGTIDNGSVNLKSGGTVVNDGLITGPNGIYTKAAGTVTNAGTIDASGSGIFMHAGGTIIDTGLISIGSTGFAAIYFASGFSASSRLIISAIAKFEGATVQLNGGALEFAADGKTVGTFAPESLEIINAGSITIDTGAIWDISGTFTNGSNGILINNGTIKEGATDLISFNGPIEGKGLIELGKKPLTVESTVAATQKLEFSGTGEELVIGDAKDFHATVEKFTIGDTIDLAAIPRASITGTHFAAGVLTLSEAAGAITITFASPAAFGSDVFVLTTDGAGTAITLAKPAMSILTPTAAPAAAGFANPLPIGTTMTATPSHLTGLTMFVPGHLGAAPQLMQTAAAIPPITLQP